MTRSLKMESQPKEAIVKSLVRAILKSPYDLEWSLQGLGMLRTYLDDERRLHIWDDRYQVHNVSQMHTHPWNFRSVVIAGEVTNYKFIEDKIDGVPYKRQSIFCGVGGGLEGFADVVYLSQIHPEVRRERESYEELAHEIHISKPLRGTVTVIRREYLEDSDHAYVFWKDGDWVSAEPRSATKDEIKDITQNSLLTWF